ncbi:MAG: ABC transporter permease [Alphaproteobacteria bacterium HGW-Alphaproteobacteria-6]|nr:MAG: ABC transporter permease [Alphaproteobacteria bacterium HGW-Alphaproteobacteria-6]
MRALVPVLTVVAAIVALWYGGSVWLNSQWTHDQAARVGVEVSLTGVVADTMMQERPVLPAPHQVAKGLWDGVMGQRITSKRSLVWHGWITLSATMLGFAIGTAAGIALAVGIVHSRAMDLSVMPWAIASQTVPILAIAPMVIVVLGGPPMNLPPLIAKAVIAAYLTFFPVVVGMVKGLRSPDAMQLDLLRTYNASALDTLIKLRLPAAMPYLFASLKVAVAASVVGTIVAELPSGAVAGLGARLLQGSYYGQTVQIWAALFMAATLAAGLVAIIALVERLALARMGMGR